MRVKIKSDVFDIVCRLRKIDEGYFVIYNLSTKKFEIHNSKLKNTYCLTVPYSNLDSRTIDFVNKTLIKNEEKILKEMQLHNEKVEKEKIEKFKEVSDYKIREIIKFSKSDEKSIKNSFQTTWS